MFYQSLNFLLLQNLFNKLDEVIDKTSRNVVFEKVVILFTIPVASFKSI